MFYITMANEETKTYYNNFEEILFDYSDNNSYKIYYLLKLHNT